MNLRFDLSLSFNAALVIFAFGFFMHEDSSITTMLSSNFCKNSDANSYPFLVRIASLFMNRKRL